MAKLSRCTDCGGFRTDARCPHCKTTTSKATTLVLGGAIAFTLMACYGGPPPPQDPTQGPAPTGDGGASMPTAK